VLAFSVVCCLEVCFLSPADAVAKLVTKSVKSIADFEWQQQLRYYWDTEIAEVGTVTVKQSNCVIPYGFEYEGATSRLVITPLTDRCWMTLTGAFHLKLGGNPAGANVIACSLLTQTRSTVT
jgi:dynein heavy chain